MKVTLLLVLALGILGILVLYRFGTSLVRGKSWASKSSPLHSERSRGSFSAVGKEYQRNTKKILDRTNFEIGGDLGLDTHDHFRDLVKQNAPEENFKNPEPVKRVVQTQAADSGDQHTVREATVREAWAPVTTRLAGPEVEEFSVPLTHPIEPSVDLPEGYGDNFITLLVRDPYWIFAYWEINEQKRQEIRERFGPRAWDEAHQVLRVFDTTDVLFDGFNANYYFDLPIGPFSSRWHIEVGQPNRTFCVERGIILQNGQYITLARSNYVTTPSDRVSSLIDEQWMLLSEMEQKLYQRLELLPLGATSPQFAYSISLAEELARFELGVSSPLLPRTNKPEDPAGPNH